MLQENNLTYLTLLMLLHKTFELKKSLVKSTHVYVYLWVFYLTLKRHKSSSEYS